MNILFVCTANKLRSSTAEAVFSGRRSRPPRRTARRARALLPSQAEAGSGIADAAGVAAMRVLVACYGGDYIRVPLAGVVIENLDWLAFIDRYDRPRTLFYLDPPYWSSEGDYGRELFGRDQLAVMAERLAKIEGRFILSINDVPEVRALFGRFAMVAVELRYSVSGGRGTAARELIVMNSRCFPEDG
ncbi:hypothetical protein [Nitratireductor sp. ZSWI3]|uniref:hypothetical protein n=1 Tax=Nitratireductor sp. ZSWI3 TaxID=2966359 RepID=UPI0027E26EBC|nr:hypothetical protein [Nitratireductor sp. ZSWI3]